MSDLGSIFFICFPFLAVIFTAITMYLLGSENHKKFITDRFPPPPQVKEGCEQYFDTSDWRNKGKDKSVKSEDDTAQHTFHRFRKLKGGSMLHIRNVPENADDIKHYLSNPDYVLVSSQAKIYSAGTDVDIW